MFEGGILVQRLQSMVGRTAAAVIVSSAVIAATVFGIGFLLLACHLFLLAHLSAAASAVATAAIAFALVAVAMGGLALALRAKEKRAAARSIEPRDPLGEAIPVEFVMATEILRQAGGWISKNPRAAGVGALAAGIVLSLNPELRRALVDGACSHFGATRSKPDQQA